MQTSFAYIISACLALLVMVGIALMSKVRWAKLGNLLSALAILAGIVFTLLFTTRSMDAEPIISVWTLYPSLLIGTLIGGWLAIRVKMIEMPQLVALLNGLGGGSSALVGIVTVAGIGAEPTLYPMFERLTAFLAIGVGMITLVGSLIAAGKLHRLLPQKTQVWAYHAMVTTLSLVVLIFFILVGCVMQYQGMPKFWITLGVVLFASLFGLYFAIRVGGADMPITISLLNSLSGVAGAIAGMAISNVLLVAVGGIVGASGLLLTQIMCRAMNRSLWAILVGGKNGKSPSPIAPIQPEPQPETQEPQEESKGDALLQAQRVIIVPGYGMALAQAQHKVKQLADTLRARGAEVRFAIHPVAGRMPGHMNVLLAEANVGYDELFEMEAINEDFAHVDLAIVIGANDVLNPAARNAEGTPIYGMPVLNVDQTPHVIICNYDLKPGYAGVENPLYTKAQGVELLLGDANESLDKLLHRLSQKTEENAHVQEAVTNVAVSSPDASYEVWLREARNVILVPGYGMALAQAQHKVKQLADKLVAQGAQVRFAIHPVAGRMPGHMNVLLAEANVGYDDLFEMEAINEDFAQSDLVVVIGANDVLNPAARDAEGTPIYGMPVLNVDQASHIIICNYDLKPGYAGVENPLYHRTQGVVTLLGDAQKSLDQLLQL